jgi:DNA polymerase
MDEGKLTDQKRQQYKGLVALRQQCRQCPALVNQSQVDGGIYDSPQIGAWSRWQGNLNAPLLLVGQDWGTVRVFRQFRGIDPPLQSRRGTNENLMELMEVAGFHIEPSGREQEGQLFFTNAVLCLKTSDDMQAPVPQEYFARCVRKFLLPLIKIIHPKVVVALGQLPYEAVRSSFEPNFRLQPPFRRYVEQTPIVIHEGVLLFAVYHCGAGGTNRNRTLPEQRKDWERIRDKLGQQRPGIIRRKHGP